MTPVVLGDVQATMTRDGTLYTLTCCHGEQKATLTTSRVMMMLMSADLGATALIREFNGETAPMRLRFPGNQMVTLDIESAGALARFVREQLACASPPRKPKTCCKKSGGCTKAAAPSEKSQTPCT